MKDASQKLLDKAWRSIATAEREVASGDAEFAVARAYYAMFYVAEALLNEKGLHFKKHGGVHGAFGEHFAKTSVLNSKYHRWLLAAFEKRVTAGYGIEETGDAHDAVEMIAQAKDFLDAAEQYFKKM